MSQSQDLFDPLSQLSIPTEPLTRLVCNQHSLPPEQVVSEVTAIGEQIAVWIETAHMIAFSIEQMVVKTETEEPCTIEPLETACARMQPVIHLLGEYSDQQQQVFLLTKIQSEWSGLQHFIASLKSVIEAANERHRLRTSMESILVQIDDLSTMLFEFQEKRHLAAIYPQTELQEDILKEIDNQVGPLFSHVEKVYTRMTSNTISADEDSFLTRKHLLVQKKWECLRIEIDELKVELKEDRWLVVFKQVADQVDEMMNKLDRSLQQCYHAINDNGLAEKNFEAKYKYYTPSIARMLTMLGDGISARVSKNTATLQRHEAMLTRWNQLKTNMKQLRKSNKNMSGQPYQQQRQSWSRLSSNSDRSDSTGSSSIIMKQYSHLDEFVTKRRLRATSSHENFIVERQSINQSPDQDMISTKDFKQQQITRSVTPNLRRSGTPSMIPRPKTPTSKGSQIARPRSSMARITNSPVLYNRMKI